MFIRLMGLVDQHVGSRIRQRRERLALTVEELACLVATHPEAIAEYERGDEHASAQELTFIADALGVPVLYFYDDRRPQAEASLDGRVKPGHDTGRAAMHPSSPRRSRLVSLQCY